ncbi:chaperonin-like RBCX protein 1, chloroplastic isoform X2 [Malania oleifera]|uniref:chaperonin-like RBCX protein 1, chloroplastic isoform X2 n=1 Tax=Malania oleifera TaxID=397392 RepID=UPI0025ADE725|nr:chaperonin-like RBCX protein 1, chloroplastic isoform X2 [Malania oleifera]
MESSAVLQLSFPPKPDRIRAYPSQPWKQKQRTSLPARFRCQKMYVPGFGEASPEAKAARNLHNFFTYVAVSIVTAQLESYNPEAYEELMEFLSRHSLNDGDKFCANLMRESSRHKNLVEGECWVLQMVDESNTRLMREYVLETTTQAENEN